MATKGYAAPEVERAYARARTLCQQVEETPELFRVLMGLHMFYRQRAELHTSSEIGAQLLSLAQSVETPNSSWWRIRRWGPRSTSWETSSRLGRTWNRESR